MRILRAAIFNVTFCKIKVKSIGSFSIVELSESISLSISSLKIVKNPKRTLCPKAGFKSFRCLFHFGSKKNYDIV